MVIVESQHFFAVKDGLSTTKEFKEFGVKKVLKYHKSSLRKEDCG
jgi:hypothetical protein